MNILTLNTGSNSLKFEIVAIDSGERGFGKSLLSGSYDNIGKSKSEFSLLNQKKEPIEGQAVAVDDHGHAARLLLDWLEQNLARHSTMDGLAALERVAHRVVHGADYFDGPAQINDDVLQRIESLRELAPLHNQSSLDAIRACLNKKNFQRPNIAVFDTVFHRTIPEHAYLYPLPVEIAHRHKIRRYGFHGISHEYLVTRYSQLVNQPLDHINAVTLHLEGGSSAAAVRNGQSIDTSMGFTPLEGLMMGTRCGDIDPALFPYLMQKENMSADDVSTFLNKKCGLLGVSQSSADTRELIRQTGNPAVSLALAMFCYRVSKYIGSYLVALGGAQAIVFGGGIGENMPLLREQICENLAWCGTRIDRNRNRETVDCEGKISAAGSSIEIWVIPTQENRMLAKKAVECSI